jgi:hypothetical protein
MDFNVKTQNLEITLGKYKGNISRYTDRKWLFEQDFLNR